MPGVLFLALAWALAAVVYITRPTRSQNRRLALLLFIEGASVGAGLGVLYFLDAAADGYAVMVIRVATATMVPAAYLLFLATLDSPLARPLRHAGVEAVLKVGLVAPPVFTVLFDHLFVLGMTRVPYAPWECICAAEELFFIQGLVFIVGLVVALSAYRRTARGTPARSRAGAVVLAFGVRDATMALVYILGTTLYGFDRFGENALIDWIFLQGTTIVMLFYALALAYGILKAQLFDIDLKVKWTLSKGTVAAAFVAVFFVASEGAEAFITDRTGSTLVGVGAAGLLLFALAPLQRAAERVSDAALPRVRDTDEYRTVRKREVYRAAVESAMQDGVVTDRERDVLATLQENLGIAPTDALRIEREALASARAVG